MYGEWEPVIGLEIHCELNTKSKLFSSAPNRFGDEPNTNISVVCTGQPGSLPVLNKEAVKKAVQFGLAIEGEVALFSKFDRKSYFYPDSPRNFQITQFEKPIVKGGKVIAMVGHEEKSFEVNRVHIEDDAGMLKHFTGFAGVDYNRAGVPLIEIVSEPCLHSAEEASAYAKAIKAILQYLDASDCNMEEGSLRFDANVSIRKKGEKGLRRKSEIKNMNSFSNMEKAIDVEVRRQIEAYTLDPNHEIPQATYRWDPDRKETVMMRSKERAEDYRYFPEPDLPPVLLTEGYISDIQASLPELPLNRERRYVNTLKLSPDAAFTLVYDKPLADYYEEALKGTPHSQTLANWLIVEFPGRYKDTGTSLLTSGITAAHVAKLVNLIHAGKITGRIAKAVADDMVAHPGKDPETIVKENPDYKPMDDTAALEKIVDSVLQANPQSIADFKAGKDKAFAFLVGQVMKQTRGSASPEIVNDLIRKKL
jgi:aspartyl-tRNA(Asn)/glutamyl-tRNA(Gln) amidotransferase subunit B